MSKRSLEERQYARRFPYSPTAQAMAREKLLEVPKVPRVKRVRLTAAKLAAAFTLTGDDVVARLGAGGRVEPVAGCQNRVHLNGLWVWEGLARHLIKKYEAENSK